MAAGLVLAAPPKGRNEHHSPVFRGASPRPPGSNLVTWVQAVQPREDWEPPGGTALRPCRVSADSAHLGLSKEPLPCWWEDTINTALRTVISVTARFSVICHDGPREPGGPMTQGARLPLPPVPQTPLTARLPQNRAHLARTRPGPASCDLSKRWKFSETRSSPL